MTTATVADALQIANGITSAETKRLLAAFGRLDTRLRSFPAVWDELRGVIAPAFPRP
jgi:hypothetical protein